MSGTLRCPHCYGSGSVEEANPDYDPEDDDCLEDELIEAACPSCTGEGSLMVSACPFCGGSSVLVERADLSCAYVHCDTCGAHGPGGDPLESDDEETPGGVNAVAAWNRRTAPSSAPASPSPEPAPYPTPSES